MNKTMSRYKKKLTRKLKKKYKYKLIQKSGGEKDYDKPEYKGAVWKADEKKTSKSIQLTKQQVLLLLAKHLRKKKLNKK